MPSSLVEEHERLEDLFRSRLQNKTLVRQTQIQFKNKLVDLLFLLMEEAGENLHFKGAFYKLLPQVVSKLSLGSDYEHLPKERILGFVLTFLRRESLDSLLLHLDSLEELVTTVFNIFVYKHGKSNTSLLVKMLLMLLERQSLKIERMVQKHLYVLLNFLRKGKEIDKVFFTFAVLLKHSAFLLHQNFEEVLVILSQTKNRFYIEHCLAFLKKHATKEFLERVSKGKESQVEYFSQKLGNALEEIYRNLKQQGMIQKESPNKKQKKTLRRFLKLLDNLEKMEWDQEKIAAMKKKVLN